ncbi:MAG TPA: glycerophosphodiester phosphodiesterase [Luteimonas sp.]|nr:glycerophosphodiester phosphodiesterase [Luteimonas sp.]
MSTLPIGTSHPSAVHSLYDTAPVAEATTASTAVSNDSWLTRSYGSTGLGPAIVGHRGVTGNDDVPENSIEALQYAADHNADGIELDIQFLGDGTPVVMHDEKIEDGGLLWFDKSLSDLNASDVDDYGLLTLEDWAQAYSSLPEPRPSVFAEFKSETPAEIDDPQAAIDGAVDILNTHVSSDQLVAASFGADVLGYLHQADPTLSLGLFASRDGDTSVFEQLDALAEDGVPIGFVEMNEDNLPVEDAAHGITGDTEAEREEQTIARLHAEGYAIVIGHTREEYLADPRVAAIISNDPASATGLRDEHALDGLRSPWIPRF